MANGKIIYPSGATSPTTYKFVNNYGFGHSLGVLETYDFQRTLDSTLKSYKGGTKKKVSLQFTRVLKAQVDVFILLYNLPGAFDLYLDGSTKDGSFKIMTAIEATSEAAFVAGVETYSFEVYMEEV